MKIAEKYFIPKKPENPLEFAASKRDEPILHTVQRAIANKQVLLAYQPVVHSHRPDRASFYEGLIRVLDDSQEVIAAGTVVQLGALILLPNVLHHGDSVDVTTCDPRLSAAAGMECQIPGDAKSVAGIGNLGQG